MGVQYERWLIPKGSAFQPSATAVAKLIERLRKDGWIPEAAAGAHAATTVDNEVGDDVRARLAVSREPLPAIITAAWLDEPEREELRLVWPVSSDDARVHYPLSRRPGGKAPYAFELHRASDYVYPRAENVGPIPTKCACGDDLAFGWDEDEVIPAFARCTGIFAECEACSRTFDPAKGVGIIGNPFDGSRAEVRGGAAYRFGLKVDCGALFVRDAQLAFLPEFVALVQDEFGRDFFEVGALY